MPAGDVVTILPAACCCTPACHAAGAGTRVADGACVGVRVAVNGGVAGPVTGVLFLALLGNGLNLLNISAYYQMIIKGALLILAVSAHRRSQPGL